LESTVYALVQTIERNEGLNLFSGCYHVAKRDDDEGVELNSEALAKYGGIACQGGT
jgi:hypothetical protein